MKPEIKQAMIDGVLKGVRDETGKNLRAGDDGNKDEIKNDLWRLWEISQFMIRVIEEIEETK